jgi:hypothetical protein
LKGLQRFGEETKLRHRLLICLVKAPRKIRDVDVLPVTDFLRRWWGGEFD